MVTCTGRMCVPGFRITMISSSDSKPPVSLDGGGVRTGRGAEASESSALHMRLMVFDLEGVLLSGTQDIVVLIRGEVVVRLVLC